MINGGTSSETLEGARVADSETAWQMSGVGAIEHSSQRCPASHGALTLRASGRVFSRCAAHASNACATCAKTSINATQNIVLGVKLTR